ncbi:MAG: NAD(P)/FAD-dependent oxidoreductase [Negativicutes bacterium]|nr:NAD(P)/FAD-dependent oxidoreductase [Negativicutes bacterium]
MDEIDIVVIGAGVVGLAVAAELSRRFPGKTLILMEKYEKFGQETSSRNSEVIHAGMYYPTGSLKAQLCVEGNALLYRFCDEHRIPYQRIGKLIIARNEQEIPAIETVYAQGQANGVAELELLDKDQVIALEPNIAAIAAVYSPNTGIIDTHKLMAQLERLAAGQRAMLAYKHKVIDIASVAGGYQVSYAGPDGMMDEIVCRAVVNSAGLYADEVASMLGIDIVATGYKIYPVKGEYFSISASKSKLVSRLVYPPPAKIAERFGNACHQKPGWTCAAGPQCLLHRQQRGL